MSQYNNYIELLIMLNYLTDHKRHHLILGNVYSAEKTLAGREKKIEMHLSHGQESPCPTSKSTCPLSKLTRTESIAYPQKCAEVLCPECLLVLWTSKTQTHTCPTDKITCLG